MINIIEAQPYKEKKNNNKKKEKKAIDTEAHNNILISDAPLPSILIAVDNLSLEEALLEQIAQWNQNSPSVKTLPKLEAHSGKGPLVLETVSQGEEPPTVLILGFSLLIEICKTWTTTNCKNGELEEAESTLQEKESQESHFLRELRRITGTQTQILLLHSILDEKPAKFLLRKNLVQCLLRKPVRSKQLQNAISALQNRNKATMQPPTALFSRRLSQGKVRDINEIENRDWNSMKEHFNRRKVLVVDDNNLQRKLMSMLLKRGHSLPPSVFVFKETSLTHT